EFDLPLKSPAETRVEGELRFADNQLRVGSLPPLAHLAGKVAFTDDGLTGNDITGEIFGGAVKLQLTGAENRVQVSAAGTANVASLRGDYDLPLADRITGTTDYTVQIN